MLNSMLELESLTLNNASRFGDSFLSTKNDTLRFSIVGYSQEIASRFEETFSLLANGEFNEITGHSPIIDRLMMVIQFMVLLVIQIQMI